MFIFYVKYKKLDYVDHKLRRLRMNFIPTLLFLFCILISFCASRGVEICVWIRENPWFFVANHNSSLSFHIKRYVEEWFECKREDFISAQSKFILSYPLMHKLIKIWIWSKKDFFRIYFLCKKWMFMNVILL